MASQTLTSFDIGQHRVAQAAKPNADVDSSGGPAITVAAVDTIVTPLPQGAWRLDNAPTLKHASETLLHVHRLELDSTSMKQLRTQHGNDFAKLRAAILAIVAERGKMHNPVTNSGGVMFATVFREGPSAPVERFPSRAHSNSTSGEGGESTAVSSTSPSSAVAQSNRAPAAAPHSAIQFVPLCSLSAIPLSLEDVLQIEENQCVVRGIAVLFAAVKVAVVPAGLDPRMAISAIDISRMLPQLRSTIEERLAQSGKLPLRSVAVLGCGNAGLSSLAFVSELLPRAKLVAFDVSATALRRAQELELPQVVTAAPMSLRNAEAALSARQLYFGGVGADLVLNCVSVDGTEAATTVLCAHKGTIVYFSMATNFARAVLSTDPVGAEVSVVCGAGVFQSQGPEAFGLLQRQVPLFRVMALQRGLVTWFPTTRDVVESQLMAFAPPHLQGYETWKRMGWYEWYAALHAWSLADLSTFWEKVWEFFHVVGERGVGGGTTYQPPAEPLLSSAKFFVGSKVNLAENLLSGVSRFYHRVALIGRCELDMVPRRTMTYGELERAVFSATNLLQKQFGVAKGSVVAAVVPNVVETVVLMLATTALGAVWTSLSPDCGRAIALQRLGRVRPALLIATRRYPYQGVVHSSSEGIAKDVAKELSCPLLFVRYSLPGFQEDPHDFCATRAANVCHVSDSNLEPGPRRGQDRPQIPYVRIDMHDPMYVLFTSGTTGAPKAIAQGFGVHLNHLKEVGLHFDLRPGEETVFLFTTCGWMLWHELMSTLHIGSTILLYDGAAVGKPSTLLPSTTTTGRTPTSSFPSSSVAATGGESISLWRICHEEGVTYFGVGARYLEHTTSRGPQALAEWRSFANLPRLRLITSTGSPLSDRAAVFVMHHLPRARVTSISGGTEINGCLVANAVVLPVVAAELQCAPLGMDVQVFGPDGKPLWWSSPSESTTTAVGELVCVNAFPSMPLHFWGEVDGERYRASYFASPFGPLVWAHGDVASRNRVTGGFRINGRSDATLNPGGVRLGTSEYYHVLAAALPGYQDALVVDMDGRGVVLFFVGDADPASIKQLIRTQLTPKHVPVDVVFVARVPYNKNNKKMEVLVKMILDGQPEAVWSRMVDNLSEGPTVLQPFHAYRADVVMRQQRKVSSV